jgi:hypothetical protein
LFGNKPTSESALSPSRGLPKSMEPGPPAGRASAFWNIATRFGLASKRRPRWSEWGWRGSLGHNPFPLGSHGRGFRFRNQCGRCSFVESAASHPPRACRVGNSFLISSKPGLVTPPGFFFGTSRAPPNSLGARQQSHTLTLIRCRAGARFHPPEPGFCFWNTECASGLAGSAIIPSVTV